jgi:hypothetical protein
MISTAWAVEGKLINDNGDGTVTDTKTGLMWQKANGGDKSWPGAGRYCRGLSLAGHSDWTLPTKDQLISLWNDGGLRSTTNEFYWSSETDPETAVFGNLAWIVGFKDGSVSHGPSTESARIESHDNIVSNVGGGQFLDSVRCMRIGK